jgi:hypothetical protein
MYNTANNAFGKLEASIWPSANSFIMQSQYSDLFPDFPGSDYFIKLEQRDELLAVIKREIVKVTNKAGDLFTIERWAWFCPASDTATEQTNTSFSFNAGDSVSLTIVSEHIQDIEERIAEKAQDDEVVKLVGDQTISDIKTFEESPQVPAGVNPNDAVNKWQLDSEIVAASATEALYDRDTYILGEDVLENDSLFAETAPTFAESTLVQNIGDVTANTRVALYGFGSGVSGNTMQLSLRKFVSPSANLSVRLETLSWWNPTGSLVDANATATVTAASLTTSLANTTITFAGSFTIPKWQKFAILLSQVWDVVNGTNYYGVGYVVRQTTVRNYKLWNGTAWSDISFTSLANWLTLWSNFWSTVSNIRWVNLTSVENHNVTQITKVAWCNATIWYIINNQWIILESAPFSWNICNFVWKIDISNWQTYTIWVDNNWASYTSGELAVTGSFPQNRTHINYTSSFGGGTNISLISNIQTRITSSRSFYTSSTLALPTVLSKTDATYTYKLPTDFPRFATESKSAGEEVICARLWLLDYPSLASNTIYYVANTPWLISAVAGTNIYMAGYTDIWWNFSIWFKDHTIAGTDNTLVALDTNRTTLSTSFVEVKRATIVSNNVTDWIYTITFQHRIWSWPTSTARILINWIVMQTFSTSSASDVLQTLNVWLKNWDIVSLQHQTSNWSVSSNINTFRIRYNIRTSQYRVAETATNTVD